MDKKNFKNAHDIGENMAVLSGEGRSYTIINKETGKTRQLVSESGSLLVADNEIDFNAIKKDVLISMAVNLFDIGLADMMILELAFAPSVGRYIQMDVILQMKMVSEWRTMTKKRSIASLIRTWKSSCLFNQWTM